MTDSLSNLIRIVPLLIYDNMYNKESMGTIKHPKIGLALGSGGARGIAHVGVLKTLEKHNIPIDYIAGSSIGALIGAMYASDKDISKIESQINDFSRMKGFSLIDFTIKGGILKGKKVEKFFDEIIEDNRIESLSIPYAAIATDINTAQPVVFRKGSIVKAIRASIAIPGFFQPLKYHDHLLADGGLANPVPVDVLYQMGADVIIAVNLDSVYTENPLEDIPALTVIPMNTASVLRHTLAKQSIKGADVVIEPQDKHHIGLVGWKYFFDNEKAQEIIKIGEEATEQAIPQIQKAINQFHYRRSYKGKLFTFLQKFRQ